MRLLLDQNLSHRLGRALVSVYPGIAHLREFGLERAEDSAVWTFAKDHGFVIVSKDSDFNQRSLVFGHPLKVAWLRLGNCSTSDIENVLRLGRPVVAAFLLDETSSLVATLYSKDRGGVTAPIVDCRVMLIQRSPVQYFDLTSLVEDYMGVARGSYRGIYSTCAEVQPARG